MPTKLLLLLAYISIITSCGKSTQESAEESLIGEWKVTQIFESRTTVENGMPTDQTQATFDSSDGHFSFTKDMMEYQYTTTTEMSSSQNYSLVTTKENSGFIKVNVFTVKAENEDFRVRFGDQTSDAHEEANEISLEQTESSDTLTITRFVDLIRE